LLYLGISSSTVDHGEHVRGLEKQAKLAQPNAAPVEPETTVQAAQAPAEANPQLQAPATTGPALTAEATQQPSAEAPAEPALALAGESQAHVAPADTANPEPLGQLAAPEPPAQAQPEPLAAAAPAAEPPAQPAQPAAAQPATGEQASAPAKAPQPQAAHAAPAQVAAAQAATAAHAAQPVAPNSLAAQVPDLKALQPPAASAAAEPARAADRGKVVLSLGAYPPNTRLRIDGVLVENPYRARVPKSSKHRIDAAALGFAPETHIVRMEADVELMISLKREPPRDVKADPYGDAARRTPAAVAPAKRDRGAGFVAENPY
jgi:hypothetical protein